MNKSQDTTSRSVAPPHNIEAEQCVLGAILNNNEALYRIIDFLEPHHFFEPIHQQIFDISRSLIRGGKLATPVTLKSFLPANLDIVGIKLGEFLARLAAEATTIINAPDYARGIVALSDCRQMMAMAEDLRAAAANASPDTDTASIAGFAIDQLDAIASARNVNHTPRISIGDAADQAIERMTEAMGRDGAIGGMTFGISSLDRKTDGLHRGELIVVAGRPGMGKTGMATSCALRSTLKSNTAILLFSLEMMGASLANRCLADLLYDGRNSPTYWAISSGDLSNEQAQAVVDAARDIREIPLEIEQQPSLNISQIAARSRNTKQCSSVRERRSGSSLLITSA